MTLCHPWVQSVIAKKSPFTLFLKVMGLMGYSLNSYAKSEGILLKDIFSYYAPSFYCHIRKGTKSNYLFSNMFKMCIFAD